MKKIVFFDVNIKGIARYPLNIAKKINEFKDTNAYFYFLYEEDPDNVIVDVIKKLPSNSKVIKIKPRYKYILDLFKNINPDVLLVMAQRIPDNALVSIAKSLDIKTFKFQHGLYIPFMKRNISMFLKKIFKTIRYLQYAIVISKAIKVNKIQVVKNYINVFIRGRNITNTSIPLDKINVDKVFVYGEYWKIYHKENYGYNLEQQEVVGYPDLLQLGSIKKQPQEDAICYICQTLVEDGRLSRKQMKSFLKILNNSIGNKKLYLKLHPRSDMSLYKIFENRKNVIFLRDTFPHCKKYIGHYSSLLAISMYLTDEIFLWKFDNHNEYPFYFVDNAKYFSNSIDDLKVFCKNSFVSLNDLNRIQKYFYFDPNVYEKISNQLLCES